MRIGDTVKAVGLAALILALNLLLTTLVISADLLAANRGHQSVKGDVDQINRIAGWSAPICGGLLFLAALAWLGRRRPERNAWTFALRAWLAYVILDAGSGLAMGAASAMLSWTMAISVALALAGALAGAALARPPRAAAAA